MRQLAAWLGVGLLVCTIGAIAGPLPASAKPVQDASRMAFKVKPATGKSLGGCQLTFMHAYTSKVNKRHVQFVLTGHLAASRTQGQALNVSVVGENHMLAHTARGYKAHPLTHLELGLQEAGLRRFLAKKKACPKRQVCVTYKDNARHELQGWLADPQRPVQLLFPLVPQRPNLVIDLSPVDLALNQPPSAWAQFKRCVADLK